MSTNRKLETEEAKAFLEILKDRFEQNPSRHKGLKWGPIEAKLEAKPLKIWAISQMEETGGEPDVIGHDTETDQYVFCDCSVESPKGRRSLCYDHEALMARKKYPPSNSVLEVAADMGIELLDEAQYRSLQELGAFDLKTSSWIQTPTSIRELGGALFCDRRYDTVFLYHNGADSYYGARGFRGLVRV
ncbi:DUF4256 domain-containing protein [Echinicola soli]|uniref:DUF4256 domain-containing protein n=1 Tax=Echinicola soli TaxID=2591634 RepID=A0A514CG48_9BACT|nr:DUF4256 domain-containing protein [Echinicola soli]QDH78634.1 DUF4256 domain-containing protein [Echinicola soli]